jgi:hypothetical protein
MEQPTKRSKAAGQWVWLGAAALLLVAVVSRLFALDSLEPWYDEVCSFSGALDSTWQDLLQWRVTANPEHSPLPFVEMRLAMRLLGETVFAMRLPSALYGIASAMALYVGVGRLVSWRTGFFSALLLLMHPLALEWSREARMYSGWLFIAILIVIATTIATQRAIDKRWTAWLWWPALGMLFMLAHAQTLHAMTTIAGAALAVMMIAAGQLRDGRYDGAARLIAGLFIAGLTYVCNWTGLGVLKLETVEGVGRASGLSPWPPPMEHVTGLIREMGGYVALPASLALGAAAMGGLWLLVSQGRGRAALVVALIGFASLAAYPPIVTRHFYASRYLLVMLAPMCVGLGAAAGWCWSQRGEGKAAVVIVLLSLAMLWQPAWWDIFTQPKDRVADAIVPIDALSRPGEVLVVVPASNTVFLRWYDPGAAQPVGDGPTSGALPPATWLLVENPHRYHQTLVRLLRVYGWDSQPLFDSLPRRVGFMAVRISERSIGPTVPLAPGRGHAGRRYRLGG